MPLICSSNITNLLPWFYLVTNKMIEPLFRNTRLITVFEKTRRVRELIIGHYPEINADELIYILSHCRAYYEGNLYYGRRTSNKKEKKQRPLKKLTEIESGIFQLLLKYRVNPSTCYRWFLAARLPEDIMNEVKHKNMTAKKAIQIARNRKFAKESKLGWQLISRIKEVVRCL